MKAIYFSHASSKQCLCYGSHCPAHPARANSAAISNNYLSKLPHTSEDACVKSVLMIRSSLPFKCITMVSPSTPSP